MKVIAPELEPLPEHCPEPDLLFRAFLVGELLLCAPPEQRDALAPAGAPGWAELETLAAHIGAIPPEGRTLGIVGEPFTLFTLHDGVPDTLEQEGWRLLQGCGVKLNIVQNGRKLTKSQAKAILSGKTVHLTGLAKKDGSGTFDTAAKLGEAPYTGFVEFCRSERPDGTGGAGRTGTRRARGKR